MTQSVRRMNTSRPGWGLEREHPSQGGSPLTPTPPTPHHAPPGAATAPPPAPSLAIEAGARQHKACEVVGITPQTLQNWRKRPGQGDQRQGPRQAPAHKISPQERVAVLLELNKPEHSSLCPGQLVARLADEGRYLVSESSMYRILRQERLLAHRASSAPPQDRPRPEGVARQANEIWSWDITYLPTPVSGHFVYLYSCLDVFSRKIVGWRVE